jgi:hypothetical protein
MVLNVEVLFTNSASVPATSCDKSVEELVDCVAVGAKEAFGANVIAGIAGEVVAIGIVGGTDMGAAVGIAMTTGVGTGVVAFALTGAIVFGSTVGIAITIGVGATVDVVVVFRRLDGAAVVATAPGGPAGTGPGVVGGS